MINYLTCFVAVAVFTDMESLPTLDSLHQALVSENAVEAEEELLSVMTHLLVCAIGKRMRCRTRKWY